MLRTGKCLNYAGCLLAYRNESITIPDDAPFVCPECKRLLIERPDPGVNKPIAIQAIILGGISLLVIMGAGAVYIRARSLKRQQPAGQIGTSFEQAAVAAEHGEYMPSRHMAVADTPAPAASAAPLAMPGAAEEAAPASPPPDAVQAQTPNLQDAQNQRVKDEVLRRIDLMPNISAEDKDKLYMSVERARQMGRILTIPFPSGHVAVSPDDVDQLKAALESAELQPFIKDPTCVLVVLGFADLKGDEQANLRISLQRAQSVLNALQDRCGVLNVMHAVGMGGSTLFGNARDADRNRVVEVWAVLP
ncbi:MAG: hypothetical protein ABSE62_10685 [Chthoniobacteraceae bacterium]|jgi:outer membrane protein OmpA-like peptidoglycan-associated protein